ncbi:MAG: sulfite exporter TauE/SafE family protein [Ruminococcaceae bacterium]|nr:sulfite exporter TauE/SafE family protein [Oscillospiraceae bacterium]
MKEGRWRACAAGAAAGIANGLFGAGGGMVLIPLLMKLCGIEERKCFATALSIILPVCLVSLGVYCLTGSLALDIATPYLIGGFFGGIGGGLLMKRIPTRWLHGILGLIILWGGIRLWF